MSVCLSVRPCVCQIHRVVKKLFSRLDDVGTHFLVKWIRKKPKNPKLKQISKIAKYTMQNSVAQSLLYVAYA